MQSYLLKDDIWWVGSIDWNLRDFHGYETSRGTTYNSYLILDDKPALVDGSRHGFGSEVLSRIAGRIDPKKIEYFVVNHVEMDHSGEVPRLVEELSPVKVLTSKRGEDALMQHYGEATVKSWDPKSWATGMRSHWARAPCHLLRPPCFTGRTACLLMLRAPTSYYPTTPLASTWRVRSAMQTRRTCMWSWRSV